MNKGSKSESEERSMPPSKKTDTLPSNKRVLHLSKSQDNDEAWAKSLEHTLQYCRHTFSPGTWRRVRSNVMRVTSEEEEEEESRDMTSRDKKSRDRKQRSRELKTVKELLRSRGQGKKERRRFESVTIHR